ncbi:MAG TPA: hypothetical protein VN783_00640 [Thermoanaerobaculia bacterium]|nr:hypothetical protein [Thermoanaerobaculia bacterium]
MRPPRRLLPALAAAGLAWPAAAASPPSLGTGDLLCGDEAAILSFAVLGVPPDAHPLAVAKRGERIWLLFSPGRLVRVDRRGTAVDLTTGTAEKGETWSAMTLDPVDGSLWVASGDRSTLHRFGAEAADVKPQSVKIQAENAPAAAGGVLDLAAAPDALYLVPSRHPDTVWRVGRDGRLLSVEFPRSAAAFSFRPLGRSPSPRPVRLARDREGAVLAWLPRSGQVYRALPGGGWAEIDASPFRFETAPAGAKLFYWKGTPVFLGASEAAGQGDAGALGSRLHFPEGRDLFEICHGWRIADLAADDSGYAVLTDKGLVLGEFAAPPAPVPPPEGKP